MFMLCIMPDGLRKARKQESVCGAKTGSAGAMTRTVTVSNIVPDITVPEADWAAGEVRGAILTRTCAKPRRMEAGRGRGAALTDLDQPA